MTRRMSTIANRRSPQKDLGAVAVEFALVLPLLMALILGIIEFGRYYNAQVVVTNAAREAARSIAVSKTSDSVATKRANAITAAKAVAPTVTLAFPEPPNTYTCTAGSQVTVAVTTTFDTISGSWFGLGTKLTATGTGAMRCGG